MLTFFDTLGSVIDQDIEYLMRRECISREEVYDRILREIERNRAEWYSGRVPNLNYHLPECRLAYLYVIAGANSNTFKYILNSNESLRDYILDLAESRRQVRVCAFGAGPGTELMAISKFFQEQELGYCVAVDFQLLDRTEEWQSAWYGIRDEVHYNFRETYGLDMSQWPVIPNGNFVACDVTQIERLPRLGNVWNQDIYVLNFILSEIFNNDPGLRAFIKEIATFASPHARFIFIDRRGGIWMDRMQAIADEAGLILSPFTESRGRVDFNEYVADLGDLFDALGDRQSPRTNWNIVYAVGVKVSDSAFEDEIPF